MKFSKRLTVIFFIFPAGLFASLFLAAFAPPITIVNAQTAISGDVVDTQTEREAPRAIAPLLQKRESSLQPFGANLFQETSFSAEREDGLNPEYIIQPGDRITLRIWGATSFSNITVVDAQGNIFIPEVGPIPVEGVRNAELNRHIEVALKRVFTRNINVYTNLEATTPVLVFVTGYVNKPGSYAGVASDSLLYFLERAGGIDLKRGSFRNITVLRDGKQISSADLYDFLIKGILPRPQFTDGDTIVVGRRGASVSADGSIRNSYSFEIPDEGLKGAALIDLSRPWANAHYTTVLGTRNNQPFSMYITLDELADLHLIDGDQIIFEVDQVHDTILIRVEGSHVGQSRFAVPRDTRLNQILDYIKVDPELADLNAISLRRESIKRRQKQAIEQSLNRLETAVLSRTAVTSEGADIHIKEAELISNFVQRAKEVEPEGILVVAKNGKISNILLQPNDIITIPEKTNVIQISGEVMVPQAVVYEPRASLKDYIKRVGGYTDHADKGKHMILRRNGEVIPIFGSGRRTTIRPGDEIVSLPEIPSNSVDIIRMITDTMFKIAASAAIFIAI